MYPDAGGIGFQVRSLISAVSDLQVRQNIGPRLTAHQNDQHGKPEVANLPESAIRPLVSCARAKRGRDGARRFGEAGRASSKNFSHVISDARMDAKYGRTREIFDRSPPYACMQACTHAAGRAALETKVRSQQQARFARPAAVKPGWRQQGWAGCWRGSCWSSVPSPRAPPRR